MTTGTYHQARLRTLGLTQRQLAQMLGLSENTVSRQFKGEWEMPTYVVAYLSALEIMTMEQRASLLSASD